MIIKLIERRLVYPIPSRERGNWRPRGLQKQNVWFRSHDNIKLHGWYLPNANARRAVVYCHSNDEHVGSLANLLLRFQSQLEATVFVFDYRGYGRSRGKPFERGCVADGLAAQRWLARREGVSNDDIVLIGRSLGGAVAIAIAAEQGAGALVLENTFPRLTDAAALAHPWLPVRLLMRNRYNSLRRIQQYHGPLFQYHAGHDTVVPIHLARRLFAASPSRLKQFYEAPRARHHGMLPLDYYIELAHFLNDVSVKPTT